MVKPPFFHGKDPGFSLPCPSRSGRDSGCAMPSVALGLSDGTLHFGALEPGEVGTEGVGGKLWRMANDQVI